ncbi:MAG: adenosylcobinamide-GDP ribazoletransferase, partial [Candidatus Omnitrophica bacterium]|nr:adenosylcobinamide-GDP ribazoletransferase [Candidatus Omnitrophota bacterium]
MSSFLAALQFLTIVPISIKKISVKQISRAVIYFPIVGLLLGLALWAADYLLILAQFDPLISNIIIVVLLIIATGGLHLDGLSDTSDALFGGRDKTEMLRIMRDPHVGTMGVLAIISTLML